MSRADLLGDEWEMALSNSEGELLIKSFEKVDGPAAKTRDESWRELYDVIASIRTSTFVSCWTRMGPESNALWRVYCPSGDGIAIETSWADLSAAAGDAARVQPVVYSERRSTGHPPPLNELAFQKRAEFEYEHEVRLVKKLKPPKPMTLSYLGVWPPLSYFLPWDPEQQIQALIIDPRADEGFVSAVRAVIEAFAPALVSRVYSSGMAVKPMERERPLIWE